MSLLLISLVLVGVIGSVIYHISEKGISGKKINPLSFIAISATAVFLVLLVINLITNSSPVIFSLPVLIISICNAVIDITIIYIYKQKGRVSLVVNVQDSMPPVILVFIGIFFFNESLTVFHIFGIIFALIGISLIVEHEEMKENDINSGKNLV